MLRVLKHIQSKALQHTSMYLGFITITLIQQSDFE